MVYGRAAKLTCDRGNFGIISIIGTISVIGIVGINDIIGIVDNIDRIEGQAGSHYCSRKTVLLCPKELGWK